MPPKAAPKFLDIQAVCRLVGGSKPVHPSWVWRHINAGDIPKPTKVGALSRWDEGGIIDALNRMAANSDVA